MTDAVPPPSRPPQQRGSPRRRRATVGGAVLLVILVAIIVAGRVAPRDQRGPTRQAQTAATSSSVPESARSTVSRRSSQGAVPLQDSTGLRLLVADAPRPFLLDVDRGTARPITGLPTDGDRGVSVVPVGEHALVLSYRFCHGCRAGPTAYLVRRGSTTATRLDAALQAVPSRDGEGVWMLTGRGTSRCAMRELGLDGRPRRAARRVSCRTDLVAELPAGLLVSSTSAGGSDSHNALLKWDGSVVRLGYQQAQPVAGNLVLTGTNRRSPLVLHDVRNGASERLRWPSRPGYSFGGVTGEPNGRLAIVEFAKYSPEHRLDMWLLEVETRRWQHLPGMPAHLVPKATDLEWTSDGRAVVLSSTVLGIWRPGAPRLTLRQVKPPRHPGSEFAVQ